MDYRYHALPKSIFQSDLKFLVKYSVDNALKIEKKRKLVLVKGIWSFNLFREINSTYTNEQYKYMFCSVLWDSLLKFTARINETLECYLQATQAPLSLYGPSMWYISIFKATKAQSSLCQCTDSPEFSLLALMRHWKAIFKQRRPLWVCAYAQTHIGHRCYLKWDYSKKKINLYSFLWTQIKGK